MSERCTRARVTVTFLAMSQPPRPPVTPLPGYLRFERASPCPVELYRYLYNVIGGEYLWWMRRVETDLRLAVHLAHPLVAVHVLSLDGAPIGLAELDYRPLTTVNLAYFGLMKHMIGKGLGKPFLHATLAQAWNRQPRAVTVNTCTADHPHALPTYLKAGFERVRSINEIWEIPDRLGIAVPERLRAG